MHCKQEFYWDAEGKLYKVTGHGALLENGKRDVSLEPTAGGDTVTVYFEKNEWSQDKPLDMESKGFFENCPLDSDTLDGSPATVKGEFYHIKFQAGPVGDTPNGTTIREMIRVLIDRLDGFQQGPLKSRENALAITKLEEAHLWLDQRERDRRARGVEGTNKP